MIRISVSKIKDPRPYNCFDGYERVNEIRDVNLCIFNTPAFDLISFPFCKSALML